MILNDLALLGTKMEVWKQYLTINQSTKFQELNKLNALLLQEITPENLNALNSFIQALEDAQTPLNL